MERIPRRNVRLETSAPHQVKFAFTTCFTTETTSQQLTPPRRRILPSIYAQYVQYELKSHLVPPYNPPICLQHESQLPLLLFRIW